MDNQCERCGKVSEYWIEISTGEYVCEDCGAELEAEALLRLEDDYYDCRGLN
jgi:DNA-directed RNA polymerase subunit RPC12/RpoP